MRRVGRRWLQAIDPGPSPEQLGKADTRSGEGPGSIARDDGACSLIRRGSRLSEKCPRSTAVFAAAFGSTTAGSCVPMCSTLHAPCDLFRSGGKVVQAPPRKRSIRSFFPSACLPFQAREERPDRPPATRACLIFRSADRDPDGALATRQRRHDRRIRLENVVLAQARRLDPLERLRIEPSWLTRPVLDHPHVQPDRFGPDRRRRSTSGVRHPLPRCRFLPAVP